MLQLAVLNLGFDPIYLQLADETLDVGGLGTRRQSDALFSTCRWHLDR
jgi:hypothetical protein